MTRKRFIKLLMSEGMSRNEACLFASDCDYLNIPYEAAYYSTLHNIILNVSGND